MARIKLTFGVAAALIFGAATSAQADQVDYTFDVHGQLIGVTRTSGSVTYTYDAAGNRTAVSGPGGMALRAASTSTTSTSGTVSAQVVDEEMAQSIARSNALQASLKKPAAMPAAATVKAYAPLSGVAAAIAIANKAAPKR